MININVKDRVDRLFNRKKNDDNWKITSYILCKEFGWDYYTLMKQPIPFIFDMLYVINKYVAKEDKQTKKVGKHGKYNK